MKRTQTTLICGDLAITKTPEGNVSIWKAVDSNPPLDEPYVLTPDPFPSEKVIDPLLIEAAKRYPEHI